MDVYVSEPAYNLQLRNGYEILFHNASSTARKISFEWKILNAY